MMHMMCRCGVRCFRDRFACLRVHLLSFQLTWMRPAVEVSTHVKQAGRNV